MEGAFDLVAWAIRVVAWILGAWIVLTLGCAAIIVVAWSVFWLAMGW